MQIILASASKQRQNLFNALGIEFITFPSDLDESQVVGISIPDRIEKIAMAKAQSVAKKFPEDIIIAADVVAKLDHEVLEKPRDINEARNMLHKLSGQKLEVVNGYCFINPTAKEIESGVVVAKGKFRQLTDEEIERYINHNPVTTWAGGYSAAYEAGINLFESMNGSLSAFCHGIPMELVIPFLQKAGAYQLK